MNATPSTAPRPTAGNRPDLDILPLTPLQEGMLFHSLYDDEGSDVYTVQASLELTGPLDRAALRRSCDAVLTRHPALRAGFLQRGTGRAVQLVPRAVEAPWAEDDLSPLPEAERSAALDRITAEDRERRFTLSAPPLVRFRLLCLAADRHVLLLTNHHILLDGWSLPLVLRDLFELYERGGSAEGMPPAPSFRRHLGWLAGQDREAAGQAWRAALGDLDEPTLLAPAGAADGPSVFPQRVVTRLPEQLTADLTRFARTRGLTVNTLVQAAWALSLARATGRQDVVFGATVSGRPAELPDVEETVGLFINTVPVRVRLDPAEPLGALLERVQREQSALLPHHHLGLADIQRLTGLGDLFDTAVVFENAPFDEESLDRTFGGVRVALLEDTATTGTMHYPLSLVAVPGRRLRLDLSHRADVVDEASARRLARRLVRILGALAATPELPCGGVGALDTEDLAALSAAGTGPAVPHPATTLPELFAAQAARTPSAPAVVFEGATLSYAELDGRATRLAHALRARGAGPSRIVAVALPRSLDLLVTLYAVHKTGAAYLPVDPDYPPDRVRYMLDDASPALVVTPEVYGRLAAEAVADGGVLPRADPREPAYMIYTSGSTGRPKGVLVPHQGIVNRLLWMQSAYELAPGDRVLQKTPSSFDVSVWEFFWPLITGATLVVARPEGHKDPEYLADLIRREGVTTVHFVPSMLESFLRSPKAADCTGLRRVICSGEALPASLADRFHDLFDAAGAELHNLYGPTEASVDVTHRRSRRGTSTASVPIGRPVDNTGVRVLDAGLQPALPGAPGELYLAGVQLAHGYHGRQALTAERFVADPFGPPGSRMYRTGDIVRWTEDGELLYLGRADDQVKIRGFRIELGEIESVLARHPAVGAPAVVVREDRPGVRRLVAYVVPADPAGAPAFDAEALRAHCADGLPEHMVPQAFVPLERLPLSLSGKLDRKALPAPAFTAVGGRAAAGPVEETLCALFAEVLGVPGVGPDDGFFELGGDSILSIQLVARARRAGLVLTPRDVFRHRTVAALASVARAADPAPAAEPDDAGTGRVPLTPIAHWLREQGGPMAGFHQSLLVRVPAGLRERDLLTALQAVLDRHDALRLRLDDSGADNTGGDDCDGDAGWTLDVGARGSVRAADCLTRHRAPGENLVELALAARRALDPRGGRVLRAVWLDRGETEPGRLLLLVHHLAVDGVSWRILLPDLAAAWRAAVAGQDAFAALDAVPTSLRTWSRRLTEAAHAPERTAELPLWQEVSAADDPLLTARPLDPARDVYATREDLTLTLPAEETAALLTTVPEAFHAGIDDILLSALALAVAHWRGPDRTGGVLVDLEGHGRQEEIAPGLDLSRTVGWFTALYPVRLDAGATDWHDVWAGGAALGRAVKTVKEQLRAVPDRGIGYGLLRHVNRDTGPLLASGRTPQIGFNYLGRFAAGRAADWEAADEPDAVVPPADPGMPLPHAVDLNAVTEERPDGPRLVAHWSWPGELLDEAVVRGLADTWFRALRALVAHAAGPGAGGLTPSDLGVVAVAGERIGQDELDALAAHRARHTVTDVLPLTPLQEGLLFHALYDEDTADVYTVQLALDLDGPLDRAALRDACRDLVRRHAPLRTAFDTLGSGTPVQVVLRDVEPAWAEHDLLPGAPEAERAELLAADRGARFPLTGPSLARFTLLRETAERHTLVLTVHHLLLDGWSLPVVLRDLVALYEARETGAGLPRPVPGATVRDHLAWLAGQDRDAAEKAWRDALAGLDGPTLLAPHAARGGTPLLPERVVTELTEAETAALTELARTHRVTLNTLFQTAWALVLAETTGRRDVVFGTTVSLRPPELPGVEHGVGMFINTVPVRVRPVPGEPLERLLARVQEEQSALAPHHHLGLSRIHALAGGAPLFDTSTVFENYPADADEVRAGAVRLSGLEGRDAYHYPMTVMGVPGDRLHLQLRYRPDLFDRETAERVAAGLRRALTGLPGRPAPAEGPLDAVRALFAEVLGLEHVGPDDDFFALGGDSLRALRLAGRVRARGLDPRLPVRAVFDRPTPRALARRLG
ncbi:amino acid adenylation domain-containing protein/non-ribosomal peptide synthase protein (TIGR01720 family) [Streptomyces sp. 3330]|uniref:non-ribosomal peptide synthetase n=1 Tax=Streptomyces sp. 3330 TaxID=2817755 RepID=UPI00285BEE99|nr:non-ribosomal peptide synthetase [Streptomyces sp. 3330]MDR6979072.1 amino acid adenylation domain-containing protein/non-ribosomal peptide synthase protein (TIGR01720 family) [Streptomyces sp. 3330]